MINPLRYAEQYIQNVEHGSQAEKIFCLIPVVNNVYLEVKRFQLQDEEKKQLKLVAATVSSYLWWQVVWSPVLAKIQGYLSFKSRTMVFVGLAIYYPLAERHFEWVKYEL